MAMILVLWKWWAGIVSYSFWPFFLFFIKKKKKKNREENQNSICSHSFPTTGFFLEISFDFMHKAKMKFTFEFLTLPLCMLSPTFSSFYSIAIFSMSLYILSLIKRKTDMLSLHRFIISSLRTNNMCVCVCILHGAFSLYLLHIYQKLNTCKVIF